MACYIRWMLALILLAVALFPLGAVAQQHDLVCDLWPPYQYYEGGELTGFSINVVKSVYARMGAEIVGIRSYPWARALESVQDGRYDVLISANFSTERTEYAHYPKEQLVNSPWIVWSTENRAVPSLESLVRRKVGVVIGYSYTQDLWNFIRDKAQVVELQTDEQCFGMLNHERVDFCIAELYNGNYITRTLGYDRLVAHRDILIKEAGLYAIFAKDTVFSEFVEKFSVELERFKKTQEYRDLFEKYLDPVKR